MTSTRNSMRAFSTRSEGTPTGVPFLPHFTCHTNGLITAMCKMYTQTAMKLPVTVLATVLESSFPSKSGREKWPVNVKFLLLTEGSASTISGTVNVHFDSKKIHEAIILRISIQWTFLQVMLIYSTMHKNAISTTRMRTRSIITHIVDTMTKSTSNQNWQTQTFETTLSHVNWGVV